MYGGDPCVFHFQLAIGLLKARPKGNSVKEYYDDVMKSSAFEGTKWEESQIWLATVPLTPENCSCIIFEAIMDGPITCVYERSQSLALLSEILVVMEQCLASLFQYSA